MNIFHVETNPTDCAIALCDSHVVKMTLETAQMCSTAMHVWGYGMPGIYQPAYLNHPMTIWVRDDPENFAWSVYHGLALADEYTYRYDKRHKSRSVLELCFTTTRYRQPNDPFNTTTPPQCMPDQYKHADYIEAYREFYRNGKAHIHRWTKRQPPTWLSHVTTTRYNDAERTY